MATRCAGSEVVVVHVDLPGGDHRGHLPADRLRRSAHTVSTPWRGPIRKWSLGTRPPYGRSPTTGGQVGRSLPAGVRIARSIDCRAKYHERRFPPG